MSAEHYLQNLQGKIAWLLQVNPQDKAFRQSLLDVQQMIRALNLRQNSLPDLPVN